MPERRNPTGSIADELITRGWRKGMLRDPLTGEVCLTGAAITAWLGRTMTGRDRVMCAQVPQLQALEAALRMRRTHAGLIPSIVQFNDDSATTREDVILLAKEADEILQAGGPPKDFD